MSEDKYIKIFCMEIEEHIKEIGAYLKTLADNPKSKDAAGSVMKSLHSIKGIAGTMGYSSVLKLSHATEELVDSHLKRGIALDDASLQLIYDVIDAIEGFKSSLPVMDDSIIKRTLKRVKDASSGKKPQRVVERKELEEKINSSVDEMLESIDSNIKINVGTIDEIIADISELKYTEQALKALNESIRSYKLKIIIKKINEQLVKLSHRLIQIKMQPFDTIIEQLERAINEYCLATGKKINFTVNTNDVMIDSTVLKILIAPLIHLIRNAVDHGIEPVQERKETGKTEKGNISLTINKVHDFVEVIIKDDGRGILTEKVIGKAIEKGYIDERPYVIDGNFLLYILTHPGFTTKDDVSTISGRGIGLDIVRSSLENIGGCVSLNTKRGEGTQLTLNVPVTTSVIRALLVKSAGETVAIPSSNIIRILLAGGDSFTKDADGVLINYIHEGKEVEVKRLASLFKGSRGINGNNGNNEYNILLVKIKDEESALLVDELICEEPVFIKPMTKPLKKLSTVLGYSISGDGTPVFMLDINSL